MALDGDGIPCMDIVLQTNTDDSALALEDVQRFADESGFGCQLTVRSHGFSARALFTFERDVFEVFRSAVEAMDRSLKGSARLQPLYEPGFIELTMGPADTVFVSGEVVRAAEFSQRLHFEFRTDQTCLPPLARALDAWTKIAPRLTRGLKLMSKTLAHEGSLIRHGLAACR